MTGRELLFFSRELERRYGLSFPSDTQAHKADFIRAWVGQRVSELHYPSVAAYRRERLEGSASRVEWRDLVNSLEISKSGFFRQPVQFRLFEQRLAERYGERPPARGPRIWSAGCARGEEPFSIALTLEARGFRNYSILATDIRRANLALAAAGIYRASQIRTQVPKRARAFFRDAGRWSELATTVRKNVHFECQALGKSQSQSVGFDFIFCRNVFYYLNKRSARGAIRSLATTLKPGGTLFCSRFDRLPALPPELQPGPYWTYRKR